MGIWIKEFLMQLLLWLLGFVDNTFAVFRAIAGIDTVETTSGNEQTLSSYFLGLPDVQKGFWIVFIAALWICVVCTIIAIVKNIINAKGGEPKSHTRTLGQSVSTVFVSLVMATMLVAGVGVADGLLGIVDKEFNGESTIPMSHNIIGISVGDCYERDTENVQGLNEKDADGNYTYVSYKYYYEKEPDGSPKTYPDGTGRIIYLKPDGTAYDPTDIYTQVGVDSDGNAVYELDRQKLTPVSSGSGWQEKGNSGEYYSKADLYTDITSESVEHLFGDYRSVVVPTSWKGNGIIQPDAFNFFVAYLCTVIVLIALIGATFGLVKRLFDIVLLFIVLPGIAATIPLDDGAKFKLWRETVISKVFLAFGTVLAVNVFLIVAPSLWAVSIAAEGSIINTILRLVLICGGALTISGGQLLFARLLGTSAEESREMAQSARTLFGGAMTALGGVKAAGRLVFGAKNANGQRVGGLIKGGAGALGALGFGTVNAAGTLFGGQAYRGSKVGQGVSATQRALRGFGNSSGWIGQDRTTGGNTLGSALVGGVNKAGTKFANSKAGEKSNLSNGLIGAPLTAAAKKSLNKMDLSTPLTGEGGPAKYSNAAKKVAKTKKE